METLMLIFYSVVFILAIGGLSIISYYLHKNAIGGNLPPIAKFPRHYDEYNDEIEHDHNKVA